MFPQRSRAQIRSTRIRAGQQRQEFLRRKRQQAIQFTILAPDEARVNATDADRNLFLLRGTAQGDGKEIQV